MRNARRSRGVWRPLTTHGDLVGRNGLATDRARRTCARRDHVANAHLHTCASQSRVYARARRTRARRDDHMAALSAHSWFGAHTIAFNEAALSATTLVVALFARSSFRAHTIVLDAPALDATTSALAACSSFNAQRAHARAQHIRARRNHALNVLMHPARLACDGPTTHGASRRTTALRHTPALRRTTHGDDLAACGGLS